MGFLKYGADGEISATVDVGGKEDASSKSGGREDTSKERSGDQREKKMGTEE